MPQERINDVERMLAQAADRMRLASDELSAAAADLFLPLDWRLTDRQRAVASDIARKLVDTVELEIRQYLVEAWGGPQIGSTLGDASISITQGSPEVADVLRRRDVLGPIMRRMHEHLIASAAVDTAAIPTAGGDLVGALARSQDPELARRAVAYVVAQTKRRDRFQEPLLPLSELSADAAYRLCWFVAAVLRRHVLRSHVVEAGDLDRIVEDAVRRTMAGHVEGQGIELRASRLALRLDELEQLDDRLLARLLEEGQAALFVAGLSVRAAVTAEVAWQAVVDRERDSLLVVARAAGLAEDAVRSILDTLERSNAAARSPHALRALLEAYSAIPASGVERVLRYWRLDPDYRAAVDGLER